MEQSFNSLAELRAGIYALKIRKQEQEESIAAGFAGPGAIFTTITTLFRGKKQAGQKTLIDGFFSQDIVTTVSKIILPFLVNNVFFRRSGFITRGIASFLSHKAAKNVNSNILADLTDKITGLFNHKKKKGKPAASAKDYGIPPDSESY